MTREEPAGSPRRETRAERRAQQEKQRAAKAIKSMSPKACELILVRHGQTAWNLEQRLQGQLQPGPPLDEVGRRQAAALAARLRREQEQGRIHTLYSSDLLRATETADAIGAALGLAPATSPALRERRLGDIQGLTYAEAEAQRPEAYRALMAHDTSARIPGGGESVQDLQERAAEALEAIARDHPGQRVLVVSHGGFLTAAYRRATGHALSGEYGAKNINGALNFLRIDPGGRPCTWAVERWGVRDHLEGVGFLTGAFGGGRSG